jgi:hypothetical protein
MEKTYTIIIDQDDDSKGIDTETIYRAVETWLDGDSGFRYNIKSIDKIVT